MKAEFGGGILLVSQLSNVDTHINTNVDAMMAAFGTLGHCNVWAK